MPEAPLSQRLALRVLDLMRAEGMARGQHLPEQRLADTFRVSRSPVREALRLLEQMGLVEQHPNRGFFLRRDAAAMPPAPPPPPFDAADDDAYFQLAEDRLAGGLPDRVSESELMRRYALPRGRVVKLLARIAAEGWAERLPGHGWAFLPMITSVDGYDMGYRFRAVVEPAALLEPTFRPDPDLYRRLRAGQESLLGGDLLRLSRAEVFRITSGFHEAIVSLAGNPFLLDGLRRVNRLRRLVEYRKYADANRLARMAHEHLHMLGLLEADDREGAAAFLRGHLQRSRDLKGDDLGAPEAAEEPRLLGAAD